ncbi:MAG: thioredoxin [Firmicutes bacterium]|jgi:thioredoxin 1|nr:thioredoxin [Bacillota bacterium]
MPVVITNDNFEAEVIKSKKPVLIDFWASWCGPCRMLSPVVDEVAEEHPELKVGKINVDEEPQLAMQFGVMSIPTLIYFEGGVALDKSVGVVPKDSILALCRL